MHRPSIVVALVLLVTGGCGGDPKKSGTDACLATYAKLEELGCIEKAKQLFARGCFVDDVELRPADCDTSVLEPCTDTIDAFAKQPGGWSEPLDMFLQHKCDPKGPNVFEMPEPDMAALRRVKAEAAQAELTSLGSAARVRDVVVQGGLSEAIVTETVERALPGLRECYASALAAVPEPGGKVSVQFGFGIDGTGSVHAVVVQDSPLDAQGLRDCISDIIAHLRFLEPMAGANVVVTGTLDFEAAPAK